MSTAIWEANARECLARQGLTERTDGMFEKPGLVAKIERELPVLPPVGFGPERESYQITYTRA